MIACGTLAGGPVLTADGMYRQSDASYPIGDEVRVDIFLESGAEVDPLELVPGAVDDRVSLEQVMQSDMPTTVVVDADSGAVVAVRVESLNDHPNVGLMVGLPIPDTFLRENLEPQWFWVLSAYFCRQIGKNCRIMSVRS